MPTKVLVMGGCHVEGFKVGEPLSFVSVFENELGKMGLNTELNFKAYVIAKKIDQILELIDTHKPEYLVLQMGNYEFNPKISIKNYFKSRLLFKPLNYKPVKANNNAVLPQSMVEGSSAQSEAINQPEAVYEPPQGFTVNLKESLSAFVSSLDGHNRVNKQQNRELYSKLFKVLKERGLKVAVISPLPIVNKVQQRYRLFGGKMFKQLADEFGFAYFDSSAALTNKNEFLPDHKLFIDMSHLNAKGHKILGTKLAEALLPHLKKA
jgi:hypothetical protein